MKCPKCGTDWTNTSTTGEVFWMVVLSILFFPLGLLSLLILLKKKHCRVCGYNMRKYYRDKESQSKKSR